MSSKSYTTNDRADIPIEFAHLSTVVGCSVQSKIAAGWQAIRQCHFSF
jgi:hypothetical protein